MKAFFNNNTAWFGILWTCIIFILCATPGQYIPSANWLDLLSFDKLVHASMFFILSMLWFLHAIRKKAGRWAFAIIVLSGIIYGGLLEIMQAKCFSNRSADWKDFVANSFGCLIAFLLLNKLKKLYAENFGI